MTHYYQNYYRPREINLEEMQQQIQTAKAEEFKPCIVIPCYRHVEILINRLPNILRLGIKIIVVDDGNPEPKASRLREFVNHTCQVLVRQEKNRGKGSAVYAGLKKAQELGFTHALQLDADGQHKLDAVPLFMKFGRENPEKLINGTPVYDDTAPKGRVLGRYMTHFWVSVELGKFRIIDTMCGMRMYPVKKTLDILDNVKVGKRMEFDTEIFVRLYWSGMDFLQVPVDVVYTGGLSNFSMFSDNLRISRMHTKLCFEKVFHYMSIRKRNYH